MSLWGCRPTQSAKLIALLEDAAMRMHAMPPEELAKLAFVVDPELLQRIAAFEPKRVNPTELLKRFGLLKESKDKEK